MKSVAIVGLALVGGAVARSTIQPNRHSSDPRTTFTRHLPIQTIPAAHDDEFGIVNVKTDIQTVVMPGNRGAVTIGRDDAADDEFGIVNVKTDLQTVVMPGNSGPVTIRRDDADNELDMHFNVPNNRGNFVVNDYTVKKDAEDDEFGIVDVKTDIQTVVMPGNRGRVIIGRDDEADNELDMHFNVPNNRGNFQVNDYTKARDDEADNELHMHFNVPNNRGNFEVNDYTVRKDAEDDEFGIVDVKTDIQTVVMPGNRGRVIIGRDDEADNELYKPVAKPRDPNDIFEFPRRRKLYSTTHDNEFGIVDVKTDIQTVVMPGNSGRVIIGRDDEADNELDMHFHVPNNRGNFQVNDYTKTHDDFDDEFGIVNVKTDLQTVVMPGNSGPVTIRRDAEDDEFGVVDYDDEFAATNSKRLNKDEIDLLASILKLATQDKEGNVVIDGVKIGKIPQKVEAPKPKKFLAY